MRVALVLLLLASTSHAASRREVAITFDDLPATHGSPKEVNAGLLRTIRVHDIPVIGFVNEGKLYEDGDLSADRVALLRQWLDAGLELGNHTFSHISIDRTSLIEYQKDVIRGETVTRRLLSERGRRLEFFRHPQLRTGPTVAYKQSLDRFLAQRGYTIAPVTIDNNEYIFAALYLTAKRRGDREMMRRVADAYIAYMEAVFAHFEQLSRDFLGYEVKQVLLVHANELNADHFDELVAMMKRRGYRFISLREALKDPAYRLPDAQSGKGLSWIHRWMLAKGQPMRPEPLEPKWVSQQFAARRP